MERMANMERLPTLVALERELLARADVRPAPRIPPAPVLAAVLALLVAMLAFTPFGRAVAERVVELVVVGEVPTRERVEPVGEPAVVIGTGEIAGEPYEIVASTYPAFAGPPKPGQEPGTCISLDLPAQQRTPIALCLTEDLKAGLAKDGITASGMIDARPAAIVPGYFDVIGATELEATRVVVEPADGGPATEAAVGRLTPKLAAEIGAPEQVSFFIALIPRDQAEGARRLREHSEAVFIARAYNADGVEIHRMRFPIVRSSGPPPAPKARERR